MAVRPTPVVRGVAPKPAEAETITAGPFETPQADDLGAGLPDEVADEATDEATDEAAGEQVQNDEPAADEAPEPVEQVLSATAIAEMEAGRAAVARANHQRELALQAAARG